MSEGEVRRPAVAGMFYEGGRENLRRQIEACYLDSRGPGSLPQVNEEGPRKIAGLVSPHAGYIYSGPPAAKGMTALAADGRPEVFVILGPNHGRGRYVDAIQARGSWLTPLGESPIDGKVADRIIGLCPWLQVGAGGFVGEHSLEVQVPFLQHLYGLEMPIVPIMMLDQDADAVGSLGRALAQALEGTDAVILASTDMTHFETPETAARQDRILIERMEAMDPEGLLRERERRGITMCGYGPVAAMLTAARLLGASQASQIAYTNSGAVSPGREVVAYLSLQVRRA